MANQHLTKNSFSTYIIDNGSESALCQACRGGYQNFWWGCELGVQEIPIILNKGECHEENTQNFEKLSHSAQKFGEKQSTWGNSLKITIKQAFQ